MGVLNDPTLLNHEILNYLLKKKITFIENIHYYIQKQTTVSIIAQVEINSSQTLPKTWGQILFLNDFFPSLTTFVEINSLVQLNSVTNKSEPKLNCNLEELSNSTGVKAYKKILIYTLKQAC